MDNKKQYYVQFEGAKQGVFVDEDAYNAKKDQLYKEHPNATVQQVFDYDPLVSDNIDKQSSFVVQFAGAKQGVSVGYDKFMAKKDQLYKEHPDATVKVVNDERGNYFRGKELEAFQRMGEFEDDAERGGWLKSHQQEYDQLLKDIKTNQSAPSQAGYDMIRRYNDLVKEREGLRRDYYSIPTVGEDYAWNARNAAHTAEEYQRMADESTNKGREDAKSNYRKAYRMMDDARKMWEAPSKYDDSNGLVNYWKGMRDAMDLGLLTMNLSDAAEARGVHKVYKKLQESLVNLNEITPDDIDRILTPSEAALLKSFTAMQLAQARRADDLSMGYSAGQGATESLAFMAQFWLSGAVTKGIGAALSKSENAMVKWLSRELMTSIQDEVAMADRVSKMTKTQAGLYRYVEKPITEAVSKVALQPASWNTVIENMNTITDDGELLGTGRAIISGGLDAIIEVWSEGMGGAVDASLNGILRGVGKGIDKAAGGITLGGVSLHQMGKWAASARGVQLMKEMGFNGFLGEMGEEWIGNAARVGASYLPGIDIMSGKEFGKFGGDIFLAGVRYDNTTVGEDGLTDAQRARRTAWESQLEMAASFGLMTGISGATQIRKMRAMSKQYASNVAQMSDILVGNSADPEGTREELAELFNKRFATPEDIGRALAPYASLCKDEKEYRKLLDLAHGMAMNEMGQAMEEEIHNIEREQAYGEVSNIVGGESYEYLDETKEKPQIHQIDFVGKNGKVTRGFYQSADGAVICEDGTKHFVDDDMLQHGIEDGSIVDHGAMDNDAYIDNYIKEHKAELQAQRMQSDEQAQREEAMKNLGPGVQLNLGTVEEPKMCEIQTEYPGGYVVKYANGNTENISLEVAAAALGTPINVMTDEQMDAAEVKHEMELENIRQDFRSTVVSAKIDHEGQPYEITGTGEWVSNEIGDLYLQVYAKDEFGRPIRLVLTMPEVAGLIEANKAVEETTEDAVEEQADELAKPDVEDDGRPRDKDGNLIPLDADGSVNEEQFWNMNPEGWAAWNDEQKGDGGEDSKNYIALVINTLQKAVADNEKKFNKTLDFKERKELIAEKDQLQQRIDKLQAIIDGYNKPVAQQQNINIPDSNIDMEADSSDLSLEEIDAQLGEPMSWTEYVTRSLPSYKFVWGNATNGTKGLGAHTISDSEEERKKRISWLANRDKGGLYPEEVAESIYNNMPEYMQGMTSVSEILDHILDEVLGNNSPYAAVRGLYDARQRELGRMQSQTVADEQNAQDAFAQAYGFENWEEYTIFEEAILNGGVFVEIPANEINEYYNALYGSENNADEESAVPGVVESAGEQAADSGRGTELGITAEADNTAGTQEQGQADTAPGSPDVVDEPAEQVNKFENLARNILSKIGLTVERAKKTIHDATAKFEGTLYLDNLPDWTVGIDAHGLAKDNPLARLVELLTNGISHDRTALYTAPLGADENTRAAAAAMGTGSGSAYRDGLFIIAANEGETLNENGIATVLINDMSFNEEDAPGFEVASKLKAELSAMFPGVDFILYSEAADYYNAKHASQQNESEETSFEDGAHTKEMQKRMQDWLNDPDLEWAEARELKDIVAKFGAKLEPIAYIPSDWMQSLFGGTLKDNRIYCGKGYFIDHAVNHHPEVDHEDYNLIQDVLNNPDHVKDLSNGSVAFTKMIGKGYAVVIRMYNEGGKIVMHKSFFWNEKAEPYKNKKDIEKKSSVGGRSTISHTSVSGSPLSARDDSDSKGNGAASNKQENVAKDKDGNELAVGDVINVRGYKGEKTITKIKETVFNGQPAINVYFEEDGTTWSENIPKNITLVRKGKTQSAEVAGKNNNDNFAEENQNDDTVSQRISPSELTEGNGVSEESRSSERPGGSGASQEDALSLEREVKGKSGQEQAAAAIKWAKERGVWHELSTANFGTPFESGDENDNYLSEDGYIYKVNNLSHTGGSIANLLQRVALFNSLFPESAYELVGIASFGEGTAYVVYRQRFVNNAKLCTEEQIDDYMRQLGFSRVGKGEYANGSLIVKDLRPRNVLVDSNGNIHVVDAEFEGSKPAPRQRHGFASLIVKDLRPRNVLVDSNGNATDEVQRKFDEEKASFAQEAKHGRNEYATALATSSNVREAIAKILADIPGYAKEYKDWASRVYKKNNTKVEAGGKYEDLESTITTIGAANERRRQASLNNIRKAAEEREEWVEILLSRCGVSKADRQSYLPDGYVPFAELIQSNTNTQTGEQEQKADESANTPAQAVENTESEEGVTEPQKSRWESFKYPQGSNVMFNGKEYTIVGHYIPAGTDNNGYRLKSGKEIAFATEEQISPVVNEHSDVNHNPSGNRLVTDERYAQLKARMKKKLTGQMNMGIDPEILAIGTEMAVYHLERGARKFVNYASSMIADLGDEVRPYLKSFYNAVRDLPEASGMVGEMDSYNDVLAFDVTNFDKEKPDAIATAQNLKKEQEAHAEAGAAIAQTMLAQQRIEEQEDEETWEHFRERIKKEAARLAKAWNFDSYKDEQDKMSDKQKAALGDFFIYKNANSLADRIVHFALEGHRYATDAIESLLQKTECYQGSRLRNIDDIESDTRALEKTRQKKPLALKKYPQYKELIEHVYDFAVDCLEKSIAYKTQKQIELEAKEKARADKFGLAVFPTGDAVWTSTKEERDKAIDAFLDEAEDLEGVTVSSGNEVHIDKSVTSARRNYEWPRTHDVDGKPIAYIDTIFTTFLPDEKGADWTKEIGRRALAHKERFPNTSLALYGDRLVVTSIKDYFNFMTDVFKPIPFLPKDLKNYKFPEGKEGEVMRAMVANDMYGTATIGKGKNAVTIKYEGYSPQYDEFTFYREHGTGGGSVPVHRVSGESVYSDNFDVEKNTKPDATYSMPADVAFKAEEKRPEPKTNALGVSTSTMSRKESKGAGIKARIALINEKIARIPADDIFAADERAELEKEREKLQKQLDSLGKKETKAETKKGNADAPKAEAKEQKPAGSVPGEKRFKVGGYYTHSDGSGLYKVTGFTEEGLPIMDNLATKVCINGFALAYNGPVANDTAFRMYKTYKMLDAKKLAAKREEYGLDSNDDIIADKKYGINIRDFEGGDTAFADAVYYSITGKFSYQFIDRDLKGAADRHAMNYEGNKQDGKAAIAKTYERLLSLYPQYKEQIETAKKAFEDAADRYAQRQAEYEAKRKKAQELSGVSHAEADAAQQKAIEQAVPYKFSKAVEEEIKKFVIDAHAGVNPATDSKSRAAYGPRLARTVGDDTEYSRYSEMEPTTKACAKLMPVLDRFIGMEKRTDGTFAYYLKDADVLVVARKLEGGRISVSEYTNASWVDGVETYEHSKERKNDVLVEAGIIAGENKAEQPASKENDARGAKAYENRVRNLLTHNPHIVEEGWEPMDTHGGRDVPGPGSDAEMRQIWNKVVNEIKSQDMSNAKFGYGDRFMVDGKEMTVIRILPNGLGKFYYDLSADGTNTYGNVTTMPEWKLEKQEFVYEAGLTAKQYAQIDEMRDRIEAIGKELKNVGNDIFAEANREELINERVSLQHKIDSMLDPYSQQALQEIHDFQVSEYERGKNELKNNKDVTIPELNVNDLRSVFFLTKGGYYYNGNESEQYMLDSLKKRYEEFTSSELLSKRYAELIPVIKKIIDEHDNTTPPTGTDGPATEVESKTEELAENPTENAVKANAVKVKAQLASVNIEEPITERPEDFGEKIGGARKDEVITRKRTGKKSDVPAWRKKYQFRNYTQDKQDLIAEFEKQKGFKIPAADMIMVLKESEVITLGKPLYDETKPFVAFWEEEKGKGMFKRVINHPVVDSERNLVVFNSMEEAEAVLPVFEAHSVGFRVGTNDKGKHIIYRRASNGKEVQYAEFDTKEEAAAYLASPEGARSLVEHKRENFDIPGLTEVTRTNMPDYRKGKNVTTEQFMNTFGFRGGEFGNWLSTEERQSVLNIAYDSLMDLAAVLGISPKAISLNGELGIAFGARGTGNAGFRGAGAAHYENARAVINLTKMNGAGSLAHEWAHALDNYFGMMDNKQDRKAEKHSTDHYLTNGRSYRGGARKEILSAFDAIVKAMTEQVVENESAVSDAEAEVEKMLKQIDREAKYYREQFERGLTRYKYNRKTKQREQVVTKPTPEQLAEYDRLIEELKNSTDYKWEWTTTGKFAGNFAPKGEAAEKLLELVKDVKPGEHGKFKTMHNVWYQMDRLQKAKASLEKRRNTETNTKTIPTRLVDDSIWFDKGRASSYWSTKVELFARCFESFVDRRIKANGGTSDYLTYDKSDLYMAAWEHTPYPAGEEIPAIDGAFENLFNVIDEQVGEDGKVMLNEPGVVYTSADGKETEYVSLLHESEEESESVSDRGGEAANNRAGSNRVQRKVNRPTEIGLRQLEGDEFCLVEAQYTENKHYSFTSNNRIRTYEDVAYIFKTLQDSAVEHSFAVLVKNGKPTIIHLGIGGFAGTSVDLRVIIPAVNDIIPDKIFMVHNHPSGNLNPSREDRYMLEAFHKAFGDKVADGIIIDSFKNQYATFNGYDKDIADMLDAPEKEKKQKVYSFDKLSFVNGTVRKRVTGSNDIAEYIATQRLGLRNKISALVITNDMGVVGNIHLPYDTIEGNESAIAKDASDMATRMGAGMFVVYGNNINTNSASKIADEARKFNVRVLDVINLKNRVDGFPISDYVSAADYGLMEPNPIYERARSEAQIAQGDETFENDTDAKQWVTHELLDILGDDVMLVSQEEAEKEAFSDDVERMSASERFDSELDRFKNKTQNELLHLGKPMAKLKACGINAEELTLSPNVLNKHLKKHNLSTDDLKGLASAIQEPMLVYKHGDNKPNIVVVTELEANGGKLSISVKIDENGNVSEIDNVRSIHPKDANRELERLSSLREGELKNSLRWVEKEKVLNWLFGVSLIRLMPEDASSELKSVAKILNDFSNPTIREEKTELMVAYHGSAADFDAFDHSHMGEGEGHQVHGWGTYVAFNSDTSRRYAATMAGKYLTVDFAGKEITADTSVYGAKSLLDGIVRNKELYRKEYLMIDLENSRKSYEKMLNDAKKENNEHAIKTFSNNIALIDEIRDALEGVGDLKTEVSKVDFGGILYNVDIPDNNGSNYIDEGNDNRNYLKEIAGRLGKYADMFTYGVDHGYINNFHQLYERLSEKEGSKENASKYLYDAGFVGIRYNGMHDKECAVIFNDKDIKITDKTQFSKNGRTVYGYAKDGKVYLSPDGINPNTPIHEYTHLWAKAMQKRNPAGWADIVKLLKGTAVWNEVLADENYQNLNSDDAIASEVLSRISGSENAKKMIAEAEKAIAEADGVLEKAKAIRLRDRMKQALEKFWNWVGTELFGMRFDSIEQVTDRVLYDLVNKTDLGEPVEGDVEAAIRTKPAPKKTGVGYKVFYKGKDGKLYPPMVANQGGVDTPVGVWLDAEEGTKAPDSKTGRPQVKQGGKGTQGGSGTLAYRPGWHLGKIPYALQFNRKDENGNKTLFPKDFVWAEVEYAMDKNYQEEAMQEGMTASGKFQHSLAGLKRLPEDGYYEYRTNPNPATDPWIITGAMKVNKILTKDEVDALVREAGREPQRVEGDTKPISGKAAVDAEVQKFLAPDRLSITEAGKRKAHEAMNEQIASVDVTNMDDIERSEAAIEKGLSGAFRTYYDGMDLTEHPDVPAIVKEAFGGAEYKHEDIPAELERMIADERTEMESLKADADADASDELAKRFYEESRQKVADMEQGLFWYNSHKNDMTVAPDEFFDNDGIYVGAENVTEADTTRDRTDYPEDRHKGESDVDFANRVVGYFSRRFNSLKEIVVVPTDVTAEELSQKTGMSLEDAEKFVSGKIRKYNGWNLEAPANKILLIANGRTTTESVLRTLFHENLHAFFKMVYSSLSREDFIIEKARFARTFKESIKYAVQDFWGEDYYEFVSNLDGAEEFAAHTIARAITTSRIVELMDYMNSWQRDFVERYLDNIDYGTDEEGKEGNEGGYGLAEGASGGITEGFKGREGRRRRGVLRTAQSAVENPQQIGYETEEEKKNSRGVPGSERGTEVSDGRPEGTRGDGSIGVHDSQVSLSKRDAALNAAKEIGVEIEFLSREEMPAGHKFSMGFWRNGKIVLCLANNISANEAVKTVLHEAVGHEGLRKLIGDEKMDAFCRWIYRNLPKSRRAIIDLAREHHGWDISQATEEYIAGLAETDNYSSEPGEQSAWEKIKSWLRSHVPFFRVPLSGNDIRYMLFQSYHANRADSLDVAVRRAKLAHRLGFSYDVLEAKAKAYDIIRDREVEERMENDAANMYNNSESYIFSRFKEITVDMYSSVNHLVEALEKSSGKKVKAFEDVRLALNQAPGKGKEAIDKWRENYAKPLYKVVHEIVEKTGMSIEEVEDYLMKKHGIERNEVFAKRDARNDYKAEYDSAINAIENSDLTELEKDAKKKKAEARLQKHLDAIEKGTDPKYKEYREKDYGGLTGIYSELDDKFDPQKGANESEEHYNARYLEARKPMFETIAETEAQAAKDVADVENRMGDLADELWKRVNAATKSTLKMQYDYNLISREQYNNLTSMFEYYVPLRGFKENTANDFYSYDSSYTGSAFVHPIIEAKGRKSQATSPIGYIGAMASSTVAQGEKNSAKLALYYCAGNRADNNLLKISDVWYEKEVDADGEPVRDDNGRLVFRPVYPPLSESLTSEEARASYEAWEAGMKRKAKEGLAFKGTSKLDLNHSVIHISESEKNAHIIKFKVMGKDMMMYVNGNPRAAQAINNELNVEVSYSKTFFFGKLLRYFSGISTSYNPEFWVSNIQRDLLFALMSSYIKNDPEYNRAFRKNLVIALKVIKMNNADANGTLGNSYLDERFREFKENGGVTGFTQIKSAQEWENDLYNGGGILSHDEYALVNAANYVIRFGESMEQITRFAAFLTSREQGKDIRECIADAKEITVNFNRKGSGQSLTVEEAKKLRWKNGKNLTDREAKIAAILSWIPENGRKFIMFFNASVQGLYNTYKLYQKDKRKSLQFVGMYAGLAALNAIIHAMMDDDDDYLDQSDFTRRTNLLLGGKIGDDHVYFKWSLPQEMRVFYALGDIATNKIMGRSADENFMGEVLKAMLDVMPLNPTDGVAAFVPSIASPFFEVWVNRDYKGAAIRKENKYLTEEEKKRTPKYDQVFNNTGKFWIEVSKMLNVISGGDEYDAGIINVNPADLEHIFEGVTGGVGTTAEKLYRGTLGALIGQIPGSFGERFGNEFKLGQFPVLSRLFLSTDERYRNAYVNDVFQYYKAEAEHTATVVKKARKAGDKKKLQHLMDNGDYRIMELYNDFKSELNALDKAIRAAESDDERKELMKAQDAVRKDLINAIERKVK